MSNDNVHLMSNVNTNNTNSRYELYHTLNQNIAKKDLKRAEKEEIIFAISKFTAQESRALYNLISEDRKIHNEDQEGNQESDIPYDGVKCGKDAFEFDFSKFPIRLRRIVYKFIKIVQKNEKITSST